MNYRLNTKMLKTFGGAAAAAVLMLIIINALRAAPLADPANQPLNQISSAALNTYNLSGGAVAYTPWFENGTWQGDLIAYPVDNAGSVSTTATWKAKSVLADTAGANANANSSTYWSAASGTNKRVIVTTDGGSAGWTGNVPGAASKLPFRYNDYTATPSPTAGTVLTNAQQNQFAATTAEQQKVINFLRGDRSNERISTAQATASLPANASGTLRERYSILGDIIHSPPQYVGGRVYVGANDGMLHVFDAADGKEVFAYVPSMVIPNLSNLSLLSYAHTYFVDGELAAANNTLVGGLGSGGKGFFALDITTPPANTAAETESTERARILWEVGAPNQPADSDLGYTFSRPTITQLKTGQWVAIAGNGYDSTDGKPVLYLMDLSTGAVAKAYADTTVGTATDKNGLSSPGVVDVDGNGFADYAYAGDINGNMWRFDLTGVATNPLTTGAASTQITSYKLFTGTNTKPIIGAPDVRDHPSGGYMVYFGTGSAFNSTDVASTTPAQSIYGIRDTGTALGASPALVAQTLTEKLYGTLAVRVATTAAVDYVAQKGWVVNLPAGERFIGNMQVRAGRVQFTSTNTTTTVYQNWLTQLDDLTGGTPKFTVFDLDKDKALTSADNVDANGNTKLTDPGDIVAAQKLSDGVTLVQVASQPVIAYLASGVDTILVTQEGLPTTLPPAPPCTINCTGGFKGGHIDVDTDSPSGPVGGKTADGLGGTTDGHVHEYDKKHCAVYVDYFSLEPNSTNHGKAGESAGGICNATIGQSGSVDLNRVTEVNQNGGAAPPYAADQRFLILMANADLSPGGKITIGSSAAVDVKTYQDDLIGKIQGGTLTSADTHTFTELLAVTLAGNNPTIRSETILGSLRISFNDASIITGGLIPTNTGCMNDVAKFVLNPSSTGLVNDRWRNGSLTIQLMKIPSIGGVADPAALANVKHGVNVRIQADDPLTTANEKTGVVHEYTFNNSTTKKTEGVPASTSLFMYEATLFWHWNGGQDAYAEALKAIGITVPRAASTPCYGQTGWQAARDIFASNAAKTLTATELAALNKRIAELKATGSSKDLKEAQRLEGLRDQLTGNTGVGGGGGGTPPVPVIPTSDSLKNMGRTPGYNIGTGKRSWYEIGKF